MLLNILLPDSPEIISFISGVISTIIGSYAFKPKAAQKDLGQDIKVFFNRLLKSGKPEALEIEDLESFYAVLSEAERLSQTGYTSDQALRLGYRILGFLQTDNKIKQLKKG